MTKKKNYITNIQEGFIRKTTLNDFFTRSQSYEVKLIKIDHATGQYEGKFKGKIKQMSYSRNFEDKVLEFMKDMNEFVKEQKEFNHKVDQRLDKVDQRLSILEKDMKEIKSLPTIKDELKNK